MQLIHDGEGFLPGVPGGRRVSCRVVGVAGVAEGLGPFKAVPELGEQVHGAAVARGGPDVVAEVTVGPGLPLRSPRRREAVSAVRWVAAQSCRWVRRKKNVSMAQASRQAQASKP